MIKRRIVEALRMNFLPGVIIQFFALSLVLGFYFIPSVNEVFSDLGLIRLEHGYFFSALSTSFFGGLIPFMILLFMRRIKSGFVLAIGIFYVLFWMWKGVEVDLFYHLQSYLFGDGNDFYTIAKKVLVDQFVFNVFYAVLCISVLNVWKDSDFSFSRARAQLNRSFFFYTFPTMLVGTWIVWVPTTAIVYSLPAPLQIPLFNLALCFYVLLVTFISAEDKVPVQVG